MRNADEDVINTTGSMRINAARSLVSLSLSLPVLEHSTARHSMQSVAQVINASVDDVTLAAPHRCSFVDVPTFINAVATVTLDELYFTMTL